MEEEMGGMEDSHPRFGNLKFSDYTSDEIKNMLSFVHSRAKTFIKTR